MLSKSPKATWFGLSHDLRVPCLALSLFAWLCAVAWQSSLRKAQRACSACRAADPATWFESCHGPGPAGLWARHSLLRKETHDSLKRWLGLEAWRGIATPIAIIAPTGAEEGTFTLESSRKTSGSHWPEWDTRGTIEGVFGRALTCLVGATHLYKGRGAGSLLQSIRIDVELGVALPPRRPVRPWAVAIL